MSFLTCLTLGLLALGAPDAVRAAKLPVPAADPAVLAALSQLASADEAGARNAAWTQLRAAGERDRAAVVQSLVYFARDAQSEREAMLGGVVLKELDIPADAAIRAVVPLLDSADERLVAKAANILGGYEQRSADRPPDFSAYRAIIAEAVESGGAVPAGLVVHMYETDPGAALRAMMRGTGVRDPVRLKELLWADHVVADCLWKQDYGFLKMDEAEPAAVEQIRKLAADGDWWVRLYAAQIMRQRPALRDDAVVKALQADADMLVRRFSNTSN